MLQGLGCTEQRSYHLGPFLGPDGSRAEEFAKVLKNPLGPTPLGMMQIHNTPFDGPTLAGSVMGGGEGVPSTQTQFLLDFLTLPRNTNVYEAMGNGVDGWNWWKKGQRDNSLNLAKRQGPGNKNPASSPTGIKQVEGENGGMDLLDCFKASSYTATNYERYTDFRMPGDGMYAGLAGLSGLPIKLMTPETDGMQLAGLEAGLEGCSCNGSCGGCSKRRLTRDEAMVGVEGLGDIFGWFSDKWDATKFILLGPNSSYVKEMASPGPKAIAAPAAASTIPSTGQYSMQEIPNDISQQMSNQQIRDWQGDLLDFFKVRADRQPDTEVKILGMNPLLVAGLATVGVLLITKK